MTPAFSETQLVVGLVIVTILAIVGGQARFVRMRQALGIEQLLASGFLFVPLGLLLSEAGIGVVSAEMVRSLDALVTLGLGILGLDFGLALDARQIDATRRKHMRAAAVETLVTLLLVGAPMFFLFEAWGPVSIGDRAASAALVGCIAAISSGFAFSAAVRTVAGSPGAVASIAEAGSIAAVIAAGVLVALFVPGHLSSLERLLALFAIGAVGGLSAWLLANDRRDRPLQTALLMGVVLVTAGTAAHLNLPPIAATLLAGVTLANLPGPHAQELRASIAFLEAPLTVLLLVIAGATMRVPGWPTVAALLVFLLLRTAGRILGGRLASRVVRGELPPELGLALLPSSAVALGLALDFHTHMRGPVIEVVMNVTVLGALLSETAGMWTTRVLARMLAAANLTPKEPGAAP